MEPDDYDVPSRIREEITAGRVAPLIVAAPSQTVRAAQARTLWQDFDLEEFLDAAEAALPEGMRMERSAVVLAGFSGAGCDLGSGIHRVVKTYPGPLRLVAAIDSCMESDLGHHLGQHLSAETPLLAIWQASWTREVRGFEAALGLAEQSLPETELDELAGTPPWVERVRRRGRWVSAQVQPEKSRHGGHLETLGRFVQLALPRYVGLGAGDQIGWMGPPITASLIP